ncbi:hypothetical protein FQR65_LT09375 [Abscondita terminalis]|nr:hypothetical protein FQR65_LT09375 [Abscondita terminalis]
MHPKWYIENSTQTINDFNTILSAYSKILPLKKYKKVIDVGCGPGNLTNELAKSYLSKDFEILVGVDICKKVIEYGRNNYGLDSKIEFHVLDISTNHLPGNLQNEFDLATSFYCFQLIADFKKVLQNMHAIIKPGGDLFLYFLGKCLPLDIWKYLGETARWKPYMTNYKKMMCPVNFCENRVEFVKLILKETGYKVHVCTEQFFEMVYTKALLSGLFKSFHYFDIPKDMENDFVLDHLDYFRNCNSTRSESIMYPKQYIKNSIQATNDFNTVLSLYSKILPLKKYKKVIDVGCGPGNLTNELAKSYLSKDLEKLVGLDMCEEVIEYGRSNYGLDSKIEFRVLDITTEHLPENLQNEFDLASSFYCLHLIADFKKVLQNIHTMLNPGGDLFLYFMGKCIALDIWNYLGETARWNPYMTNYKKMMCPVNFTKNRTELVEFTLKETGYKVHVCTEQFFEMIFTEEQLSAKTHSIMHPKMYIENSTQTINDFKTVLSLYSKILPLKNYKKVIDVGCGPGNLTNELAKSYLSKDLEKLVGVDICEEVIEYGRNNYGLDPKIEFRVLDVTTNNLLKNLENEFDLATSFYCLHLIAEFKEALQNMYALIKPGGDLFVYFMGKYLALDIWNHLEKTVRWKPYMKNYKKIMCPVNFSKNRIEFVECVLKEIGFKVHVCTEQLLEMVYTKELLSGIFKSFNFFNIPKDMENDFVREHLDYFRRCNSTFLDSNMHPKMYIENTAQSIKDLKTVLSFYSKILPLRNYKKVIDIGCGPGNITNELAKSYLPKDLEKLVGVDICEEVIEYARENYGLDSKIEFHLLDITTDHLPENLQNEFDLATSFYCLQLIADLKKVLQNIHLIIKPGGDLFLYFMGKCLDLDIWTYLGETARWKPYMTNYKKMMCPVNFRENRIEFVEIILKEIGFKVHVCTEKSFKMVFTKELLSDSNMHPKMYIENSTQSINDFKTILSLYSKILPLTKYKQVIDVGCGPGNLTNELAKSYLSKNLQKLVGVDICEKVIEYGRDNYGLDRKIEFHTLDVTTDHIPENLLNEFDLATSFYCLQIIGDLKKALQNMHAMIKPGGDLFIYFMGKCLELDIWSYLGETTRWKPYMRNYQTKICPVNFSANRIEFVEFILKEIGYKVHVCTEKNFEIVFTKEGLSGLVKSMNFFNIPKDMENDFVTEHLDYFRQCNATGVDENEEEIFVYNYTLIIVYASK